MIEYECNDCFYYSKCKLSVIEANSCYNSPPCLLKVWLSKMKMCAGCKDLDDYDGN